MGLKYIQHGLDIEVGFSASNGGMFGINQKAFAFSSHTSERIAPPTLAFLLDSRRH